MTRPCSPTILIVEYVTGGGLAGEPLPASWAAEGRAMRRTLAADFARIGAGARVVVALDERFAPDDGPWTTAAVEPGAFPDRLRELAREADYTVLVAPETTGLLARLTVEVEDAGGRVLGASADAVALAADKSALAFRFHRNAVPTPRSLVVDPRVGLPADWTSFPAVLKPIDGAGAVETFKIDGPSSLPVAACSMPAALLQPLVPGEAMSASFLVSERGDVRWIATGRQRVTIRDGRFAYDGGMIPDARPTALPVLLRAVETVEGLRGFVGVDFLWDADRCEATVLEINPRATTSVVGLCRIASPGLLARAWLAGFTDPEEWDGAVDRLRSALERGPRVHFSASGDLDQEETT